MTHDVYVFGDSHWRVFFPFVNTGDASANVSHEQDGVRTIDTIGNELSGSTMWGLLNPVSKHGARSRILDTLDRIGGADNVALVFGEVDARYHHDRYFTNGKLSQGKVWELVSRYVRFVQEDLFHAGRVKQDVFIYHGFDYPQREGTLLQPGQPMGEEAYERADMVNCCVNVFLRSAFSCMSNVTTILPSRNVLDIVSEDGVHLIPELVYNNFTLPGMKKRLR
jgi:hypothetical protein